MKEENKKNKYYTGSMGAMCTGQTKMSEALEPKLREMEYTLITGEKLDEFLKGLEEYQQEVRSKHKAWRLVPITLYEGCYDGGMRLTIAGGAFFMNFGIVKKEII